MAEVAETIGSERQALETALAADPKNAGLHVKLAQLEAKAWAQSPESADLEKIVLHLDLALETLPASHHPQLLNFAVQLQQRGAALAPLLKSGKYSRLLALVTKKPVPQGNGPQPVAPEAPVAPAAAKSAPAAETAPTPKPQAKVVEPPVETSPTPVPAPKPSSPAADAPDDDEISSIRRARTPLPQRRAKSISFSEVEVGEVTNAKIKSWLDQESYAELGSAYPLVDNFRTRRLIIDKVSEKTSPVSLTALIHMLCYEHDEKSIQYVTKKILAFPPEMILAEAKYEPTDIKYKTAVITVFAAMRNQNCVKQLTQALRDRDASIRAHAIDGLAAIVKPSAEWLKELARIVGEDRDANVRLAAARALQTVNTEEAFQELNAIAIQKELDKNIKMILDEMSAKFLTQRLEESRAKQAEEARSKRKKVRKGPDIDFKQFLILGVVALLLAIAGYFAWTQAEKILDPTGAKRRLRSRTL